MLLANQATPAAFSHKLFNQSSVRVESLICLSRLICLIESKCVKVFFFTILSRQDTNSRPAVQEDISNPALVWSDLILAINLQWLKMYCRYCTEVACMFIISLFLVQFFSPQANFYPNSFGENILCRCWRRPGYLHPLSQKNNNWGHLPWYALMHMKNVHK